MEFKTPGKHKRFEDFAAHWRSIAPDLGCDEQLTGKAGAFGRTLEVGGRTIGNRWAIHPMEGWDARADGMPSEHTLRRWKHFGQSGAKLIWGGEAVAVLPEARANPHQLFINPEADIQAGLGQLRSTLTGAHGAAGLGTEDLYIGLQLTHSGRFSRPTSSGLRPRVAYRHPILDPKFGVDSDAALISDAELDDLIGHYVRAAVLAQAAGFDFVDVKCCHGYLLHELLGAKTRPGPYGGSFENRTRFFRDTVAAIEAACPGLGIGVRVSIGDSFPFAPGEGRRGEALGWEDHVPYRHGFGVDSDDPRQVDLTEGVGFLELVQSLGIRLVNLTVGSPYYNPHMQRPASYPPSDGYLPPEDPLVQVAGHLRITRRCKAAVPELTYVGTGYTYLQEWLPNVGQHELAGGHVDFVGLGRMVLSYPEMPRDVLAGNDIQRRRICRTFSDCTTAPRNGLRSGCYPLDEHYKRSDEAETLRGIKEGLK